MRVFIKEIELVYEHIYTVRFDFDLDILAHLENVKRKISETTNKVSGGHSSIGVF